MLRLTNQEIVAGLGLMKEVERHKPGHFSKENIV
jgi:hypothetical protein